MSTPFLTSKVVSSAEPVAITVNTQPEDLTPALSGGARNRKWTLTADTDSANFPDNPYRAAIVVDNRQGAGTAWLVYGLSSPDYTQDGAISIPSGNIVTFSRDNHLFGTGKGSVALEGTSTGTIVIELSYEAS